MSQPVAIVTGASRGIGRAIAVQLAGQGYDVVVNYHRSRQEAERVVDEIRALGRAAVAAAADVSSTSAAQPLLAAADALGGRLDVLVNNAGITSPGRCDLLQATEESWDLVLATNLKGPFFLAQAVIRKMLSAGQRAETELGCLVNISSISAYAVSTDRGDYCIAKAGMQMMTWLYASRLAQEGIRVFEVCPGIIASDMTAPVREKYDRLIADGLAPIRRWGQPEDVARAVGTLVAGGLPYATGERINVDGGFHIRRL